jgi:hypothetical protein
MTGEETKNEEAKGWSDEDEIDLGDLIEDPPVKAKKSPWKKPGMQIEIDEDPYP